MKNENEEEWKEYPLNRNYYVSDMGRVKNRRGKIMSPKKGNNGYLFISASICGRKETTLIHRMVMLAFNYDDEWDIKQVNHKNGIRTDNRLCNLEWVTPLFNVKKMNREQRELQKILQDAVVHAGYERVKSALKLLCE